MAISTYPFLDEPDIQEANGLACWLGSRYSEMGPGQFTARLVHTISRMLEGNIIRWDWSLSDLHKDILAYYYELYPNTSEPPHDRASLSEDYVEDIDAERTGLYVLKESILELLCELEHYPPQTETEFLARFLHRLDVDPSHFGISEDDYSGFVDEDATRPLPPPTTLRGLASLQTTHFPPRMIVRDLKRRRLDDNNPPQPRLQAIVPFTKPTEALIPQSRHDELLREMEAKFQKERESRIAAEHLADSIDQQNKKILEITKAFQADRERISNELYEEMQNKFISEVGDRFISKREYDITYNKYQKLQEKVKAQQDQITALQLNETRLLECGMSWTAERDALRKRVAELEREQ